MSVHRGNILKEELKKYMALTGASQTAIANKAGYDQSTPYRHFAQPDLPIHIIFKYANVIDYDLTKSFPELTEFGRFLTSDSTPKSIEKTTQISEGIEEWRDKYIALLEKYNRLLESITKN